VAGCFLASDHITNCLVLDGAVAFRGVTGSLPEDRERLLELLRSTIRDLAPHGEKLQGANDLYAMGFHRAL
jgi:hypothetical protein